MSFAGLKVIGYTRVSTDDQADTGVSLIDQPVKIRAFCTSNGMDLIDIIEDAGECSKSLNRPGMNRVLALLDSGEAKGVVVAKMDRLTRHIGDLVHLVEKYFMEPERSHLFSASDHVDTMSAVGRCQLYLMGVFSQYMREQIVENTAGAMAGKRSRSERTGNVRFGLKVDADDSRRSKAGRPVALVPCAEDLAIAEMIVELRNRGLSMRGIAEALNRQGIPSKRGVTKRSTGRWSHSTVAEILKRVPSEP